MDEPWIDALEHLAEGQPGIRLDGTSRAGCAFNRVARRLDELEAAGRAQAALDHSLEALTATLLGVATGTFADPAPRTGAGDSLDVLTFLINATAEEVAELIRELQAERHELRRTQDQLIHAEKLSALGRLAAGVAHEMNQPLTAIMCLVEMVRMQPDQRVADVDEDLRTVERAAEQMARIVSDVRTFGRRARSSRRVIPALEPPEQALRLLAARLKGSGVRVDWQVEPSVSPVMANADRLQQVFVNLLRNALDAMAPSTSGTITLGARNDGAFVVYTVDDEGPGIAPDVGPSLFEPFFTTKQVGEGTGLGLSVSLGIVRDHGGELTHASSPAGGARFEVRIPRAPPEAEP